MCDKTVEFAAGGEGEKGWMRHGEGGPGLRSTSSAGSEVRVQVGIQLSRPVLVGK